MRRILSLALALTIVACGSDDDSTAPTPTSVAGTWTLQTVNGSSLPFTVSASPKIEVLSYVVNVSANGTWTSSEQTRTTIGTQQPTTATVTDGGTYTLSGNSVAITSNTAGSTVQAGAIVGNTLTLTQSGFVFVFTK